MADDTLVQRAAVLMRPFDDRVNPILVKEVRQALRGKFFRISFLCTLVAVTLAGMSMIMDMDARLGNADGRNFFVAVFVCLVIAVVGLVPFAAFHSMGSEWDENTFDLLVISNLRPRQIVMGKLLSAVTQIGLFFSAFTPFLVFTFVLREVDLRVVVVLLAMALFVSVLASIVALTLSTLSRVRFARVVLMAGLAGLLVSVISPAGAIASQLLRNPGQLRDDDWIVAAPLLAIIGTLGGAFCFIAACNMLAHPEENRSTGMRVLSSVAVLVSLVFLGWVLWYSKKHSKGLDREFVSAMGMVVLGLTLIPSVFFVTEREALGRRVRPRIPRQAGLAALVTPWLPGGARGVVLFLLHAALITLFVVVAQSFPSGGRGGRGFFGDGVAAYLAMLLYGSVYILLPSGLMAPFTWQSQMRMAVRVLIPFLVLVFAFAPALLGFFLGDDRLMAAEHAGNPFYLIERSWERGITRESYWMLLLVLVAVAALVNVRRMWVGVREVAEARRERLQRDVLERGESMRGSRDAPDAVTEA